ncbi:MAG: NUDIX domain-containing protein [Planctomycetota bacterium]
MTTTKTDHSCGVIPYRVVDGRRQFLLIQHRAGHWAFPKGHPEGDESPIDTARRELREETGLAGVALVASPAFEEHYAFTKRSGVRVEKTVTYYLGEVPCDGSDGVVLQEKEVSDAAWCDEAAAYERMSFDEGRRLLDEVLGWLSADSNP